MIKLNDNSIFVGQIKQLLKNFNLPKCSVGSENAVKGDHFIANNSIFFKDEKDVDKYICPYIFNESYLDLTHNLEIRNILYDRYTHRYLGNYLRFLRDYKGIDLMSMYNCFDQEINEKILSLKFTDEEKIFTGINNGYVTYTLPVVLNKKYTIVTNFFGSIETCLTLARIEAWNAAGTFTGGVQEALEQLGKASYKKYSSTGRILIDPFTWLSEEKYSSEKQFLEKHIHELRLLIKIPARDRNIISILEGNYIDTFNIDYENVQEQKFPTIVKNLELEDQGKGVIIYNPQLLSITNNDNYILADRLVEYLVGNAISFLSRDYDILKGQKALSRDNKNLKISGRWNDEDTRTVKSTYIMNPDLKLGAINYDMIGYIDKDVEQQIAVNNKGEIV